MLSLFDAPEDVEEKPAMAKYNPEGVNYTVASDAASCKAVIDRALSSGVVGVALYAVGAEDMTADWYGIAIAVGKGESAYIPIPVVPDLRAGLMEQLKRLFISGSTMIVSHDVKRDIILLRREGIDFTAAYYDTAIAHYLIEPEMNHALPHVAAAYLGYHTVDYTDDVKLRKKGESVAVGEEQLRFNEEADITLRLYDVFSPMIDSQGHRKLLDEIELPLVKVLADMEWTGVRIDVHVLAELSRQFTARLRSMEAEAYRLAGVEFNIGSPSQVGEVLFERLKLDPKAKRTKKGGYSTTEEILDKYRDAHPLVGLILDTRGMRELRLIADISGDKDMIEAFISDADIHQSTAAKIYHVDLDDVTPQQRSRAKTANFGIIYGISAFGLSQRLHIPRGEAKELIDGYFRTYPHIKEYISESIEKARSDGYVSTIMGRKRMLPDINSRNAVVRGYAERNAVNAPIQGSAADIIKAAMVRVSRDFAKAGLKSKMIMQVHDELIFNVVPEELPQVKQIVHDDMVGAYRGKVPLEVSSGVGANWLEAH